MKTCGTCKYFGDPFEEDFHIPTGYHVCKLIEHINRHEPGWVGSDQPITGPIAVVIDASDYYATICVKEDFGCNQHADRDS